jgi:hypothetical protein
MLNGSRKETKVCNCKEALVAVGSMGQVRGTKTSTIDH